MERGFPCVLHNVQLKLDWEVLELWESEWHCVAVVSLECMRSYAVI